MKFWFFILCMSFNELQLFVSWKYCITWNYLGPVGPSVKRDQCCHLSSLVRERCFSHVSNFEKRKHLGLTLSLLLWYIFNKRPYLVPIETLKIDFFTRCKFPPRANQCHAELNFLVFGLPPFFIPGGSFYDSLTFWEYSATLTTVSLYMYFHSKLSHFSW